MFDFATPSPKIVDKLQTGGISFGPVPGCTAREQRVNH